MLHLLSLINIHIVDIRDKRRHEQMIIGQYEMSDECASDGNRTSAVKDPMVLKMDDKLNSNCLRLNPLDYPSLRRIYSEIDLSKFKCQKDGGRMKYLFLNNENNVVCLSPYLRINKTQSGKNRIPGFDTSYRQYICQVSTRST